MSASDAALAAGTTWPDLSRIKAAPPPPDAPPAPATTTKCARCGHGATDERCSRCGAIKATYTKPERTR